MAITSDMDAIWGRCEGYAGAGAFPTFIRAQAHEPDTFYIAFRDETADSIRDAIALRRQQQTHVGAPSADPPPAIANAMRSIAEALGRLMRALPVVVDILRAFMRLGVGNVVRGAQQIVASLNRYPLFRVLNRLTGNRMPPRQSPYSSVWLDNCAVPAPLVPGDEVTSESNRQTPPTFREDVVRQNQLTLVTVVKPGHVTARPGRHGRDRFVLETAGTARLAHRDQHDSFRQMARHR